MNIKIHLILKVERKKLNNLHKGSSKNAICITENLSLCVYLETPKFNYCVKSWEVSSL